MRMRATVVRNRYNSPVLQVCDGCRQMPSPRGCIPKDLGFRERMERMLRTKAGRKLYKIRGRRREPVFGTMKSAMGFRQFMRRGCEACESELLLMAPLQAAKIFRNAGFQGCPA